MLTVKPNAFWVGIYLSSHAFWLAKLGLEQMEDGMVLKHLWSWFEVCFEQVLMEFQELISSMLSREPSQRAERPGRWCFRRSSKVCDGQSTVGAWGFVLVVPPKKAVKPTSKRTKLFVNVGSTCLLPCGLSMFYPIFVSSFPFFPAADWSFPVDCLPMLPGKSAIEYLQEWSGRPKRPLLSAGFCGSCQRLQKSGGAKSSILVFQKKT